MTDLTPEVVVVVDAPPEINVLVEPQLPEIQVEVSEVGMPGPPGRDEVLAAQVQDHILSETPHPAYDDGSSFLLLYLNAKV